MITQGLDYFLFIVSEKLRCHAAKIIAIHFYVLLFYNSAIFEIIFIKNLLNKFYSSLVIKPNDGEDYGDENYRLKQKVREGM